MYNPIVFWGLVLVVLALVILCAKLHNDIIHFRWVIAEWNRRFESKIRAVFIEVNEECGNKFRLNEWTNPQIRAFDVEILDPSAEGERWMRLFALRKSKSGIGPHSNIEYCYRPQGNWLMEANPGNWRNATVFDISVILLSMRETMKHNVPKLKPRV